MAKKDKKDKKNNGKKDKAAAGAVEAVDAVRSAVERTFAATAEGAQSLRGPAQELAGELAVAANRIREVLEDRVLDELKGLRSDVEGLAQARLRARGEPARRCPATTTAARKPAARRASSSAAQLVAAKRSSSKPSSSRSTSAAKSSSSRSSSTRSRRPRRSGVRDEARVRKPSSTAKRVVHGEAASASKSVVVAQLDRDEAGVVRAPDRSRPPKRAATPAAKTATSAAKPATGATGAGSTPSSGAGSTTSGS